MRYVALLLLALPALANAQVMRDSIITVTSQRTIRLNPDRASFFVTVDGTAETAGDAVARGKLKVDAVVAALRSLGRDVEIGIQIAYAVGPTVPNRGYPIPPNSQTLTARSAIRVHVRDVQQLTAVLLAATNAGASGTSAMSFESTAADSVRLAEAGAMLQHVRREADVIAAALGGRIGALVDVNSQLVDRMGFQPNFLPGEGSFQPVQAPEVPLSLSVTARFRLVSR